MDGKGKAEHLYGDKSNVVTLDGVKEDLQDTNGKAVEIDVTIRIRKDSTIYAQDVVFLLKQVMKKIHGQLMSALKVKKG